MVAFDTQHKHISALDVMFRSLLLGVLMVACSFPSRSFHLTRLITARNSAINLSMIGGKDSFTENLKTGIEEGLGRKLGEPKLGGSLC